MEVHVRVCIFNCVLYLFMSCFEFHLPFFMTPTWLMDQISGKACYCSHADLVRAPINASQWFFSCPSFGFLSIFLSVVGFDPLPISTVRIPNRGARTRGKDWSLTPPLTTSELSSTSLGTRLVVLFYAFVTRKKTQESQADTNRNVLFTVF